NRGYICSRSSPTLWLENPPPRSRESLQSAELDHPSCAFRNNSRGLQDKAIVVAARWLWPPENETGGQSHGGWSDAAHTHWVVPKDNIYAFPGRNTPPPRCSLPNVAQSR